MGEGVSRHAARAASAAAQAPPMGVRQARRVAGPALALCSVNPHGASEGAGRHQQQWSPTMPHKISARIGKERHFHRIQHQQQPRTSGGAARHAHLSARRCAHTGPFARGTPGWASSRLRSNSARSWVSPAIASATAAGHPPWRHRLRSDGGACRSSSGTQGLCQHQLVV